MRAAIYEEFEMAKDNSGAPEVRMPKKADIILKTEQQISFKLDELMNQVKLANSRITAALALFEKNSQDNNLLSKQMSEVFLQLENENKALKQELLYLAKQNENIYTGLNENIRQISEKLESGVNLSSAQPVATVAAIPAEPAEVDYDLLARKVAELVSTHEQLSPDYIASKVAEQIVIPAPAEGEARPVAAVAPVAVPVQAEIDADDLADKIAVRVGSLKAEDFEILVDDEGCESISKEVAEHLNYDVICASIAEKLSGMIDSAVLNEPDYEEMAHKISENINVTGISEDSIAEKTAEAISNRLPEVDSDEIADKVTASVLEAIHENPVVDNDVICANISDKLIQSQEDRDYDIVIDEEGISKITDVVTEEVQGVTKERFDKVDEEIKEIKALLAAGAVVATAGEIAAAQNYESYVAEDSLVTVSDIVVPASDEEEEKTELDEVVEEIAEEPVAGEIFDDGVEGGVDFAHMMKYNRSFIARIIQGTDEQKAYYGEVKTALLSYKKVNSNVAWGAERFNKGRETIAKFKIRGKTLCLYLALDPNEFKTSVYHQVDVSDNKSMHGTPMMVKIKSPLGVKKAIRLIDEMLARRDGVKHKIQARDYAAMYPYESMEQLIEDGLVKDVRKEN